MCFKTPSSFWKEKGSNSLDDPLTETDQNIGLNNAKLDKSQGTDGIIPEYHFMVLHKCTFWTHR